MYAGTFKSSSNSTAFSENGEDKKINFNKKILDLKVPILGLCFGHQLISRYYGGKVITAKSREFGLATIKKKIKYNYLSYI